MPLPVPYSKHETIEFNEYSETIFIKRNFSSRQIRSLGNGAEARLGTPLSDPSKHLVGPAAYRTRSERSAARKKAWAGIQARKAIGDYDTAEAIAISWGWSDRI